MDVVVAKGSGVERLDVHLVVLIAEGAGGDWAGARVGCGIGGGEGD